MSHDCSGGQTNMLSGLTGPDRADCAANTCREPFLEWKVALRRHEVLSGETLGDSSRVAVVSGHSIPKFSEAANLRQ